MPQGHTGMEIKRVKSICDCMDFLEWIRSKQGRFHNQNEAIICQVGELDTLSELHRLLYDFDRNKECHESSEIG